MRKYDNKNKISIGVIGGISVLVIIIFSYFIFRVIKISNTSYVVDKNTVLYDSGKNMILVRDEANIKVKWNNNYYLIYDDDNYDLGKNNVLYNVDKKNITLYGKYYEILSDATVNIINNETKLENDLVSHFYKIDDRKYLLIASRIYTENSLLDTSGYLMVELDKEGNAVLYNDDVNLKTFKETTLITNDYKFDIAKEILDFNGIKIDLKKIIGSSNEYSSDDLLVSDTEIENASENTDSTGDGAETGSGNGTVGNTSVESVNSNSDKVDNTIVEEYKKNVASANASVIRVIPSINSLDIDYVIYDPESKFINCYVEVINLNNNTSNIYNMLKSGTDMVIDGLEIGTKYSLNFYKSYYDSNNTLVNDSFGNFVIYTKSPTVSLVIDNISNNKINYNIVMDDNYNVSNYDIEVYYGDKLINTYNNSVSGSTNKISGSIDMVSSDYSNDMITIKLKDIVIDGVKIQEKSYYKFHF